MVSRTYKPDQHQHRTRQKRNAPAEVKKLVVGEPLAKAAGKCRRTRGIRRARPVAGTCRTRRACPAAHSQSPAAPRRPTRRPARGPARSGKAPAAPARKTPIVWYVGKRADRDRRKSHREQRCHQRGFAADAVAEVSKKRGTHRPREKRNSKCGQRSQPSPKPDRTPGKTISEIPAPPPSHRYRNRKTRWWCRSGWQTAPGPAD